MGTKYNCKLKGLQNNWVEVVETWSLRESRELNENRAGLVRERLLAVSAELERTPASMRGKVQKLSKQLDQIEADLVEARKQDGESLFHFLQTKLDACHLERMGGQPAITDPKEITEEALEDMDVRLVKFLGMVLPQAVLELQRLGNTSVVLSSGGSERAETSEENHPEP